VGSIENKNTSDTQAHDDFRAYLRNELLKRCRQNPSYSARSFARFLGIESSWLSKILRGQRPTAPDLILKLGTRIGLTPKEIENYLSKEKRNRIVQGQPASEVSRADLRDGQQFLKLAQDTFEVISDWYHVAILELMKVDGFKSDSRWIARKLGVPQVEIDIAVERLCRVNLLEIDSSTGDWKDLANGYTAHNLGPLTTSSAHREFQRQLLDISTSALKTEPIEKRDHSSMVMAIDPKDLEKAKGIIDRFRHEMSQFLESNSAKSEVYALQIGLFPLSSEPVSAGKRIVGDGKLKSEGTTKSENTKANVNLKRNRNEN
jgi:uncharacterized protein (TIGR02147 family)